MAIRPIVTAENPLLREKSKKVSQFGSALHDLVEDMFDSMHAANGLGLAAPQIGVLRRVFIVQMLPEFDEEGNQIAEGETYVLVNPEIVKARGEEKIEEACLSVPGYQGRVRRATHVLIKGQDVEGKSVRYRGNGLLAQAFQHESDHLNGVLYIDRIESPEDLWRVEAVEAEN